MIVLWRAYKLHKAHPPWPWDWCMREAKRGVEPMPWDVICWGAIVVCVCLFLFSAAIGDMGATYHKAMLAKEWACTRAEYGVIWIGDKSYPGVKCTEEINLNTEEVRKVK